MNKKVFQDNIKAIDKATKKTKDFLAKVLDEGSFVETDVFTAGKSFLDGAEALGEGVVTGYAAINEWPVHLFAQNAEVMKGSFSEAHAAKIKKVINKAIQSRTPLISFVDCSGARVGEGVRMLEAYAEVIAALSEAKLENIPHICVVKGNAVGMMASLVAMADFVIMSDKAVMSVSAPQAIASREKDYPKLTAILGADSYSKAGTVCDFSYKSEKDLARLSGDLLTVLRGNVNECTDDCNRETPALDKRYDVKTALKAISDNEKYLEANADYAKELVTAYTCVNSISVGILAFDSSVNDGYLSVAGVDKAISFMEKAIANNLPVITLLDCLGIKSCQACEAAGLNKKIARLMTLMSDRTIEKIGVIAGKAVGMAYTIFASKGIGFDYTLASVNAEISPITGEQAVNVVYAEELKDGESREKLAERYNEMQANPFISAKDGYVDNIIEMSTVRPYVASALLMLLGL